MSDEAAFLRAICDQPDEDTPRLAFADWLTERGGALDVAWASGIRAQVAAARDGEPVEPERATVFDTPYGQARLLARLGVGPALYVHGWWRGFPYEVGGDYATARDAWRRIGGRVPVHALVMELPDEGVAEFLTWPGLEGLRMLKVNNYGRFGGVPALAACPRLCGLAALVVTSVRLSEADAVAVLDSPHFGRLEHFDMHHNPLATGLTRATAVRLAARFGPKFAPADPT